MMNPRKLEVTSPKRKRRRRTNNHHSPTTELGAEIQLIGKIDSGLKDDIDSGEDADESELEIDYSNSYKYDDEHPCPGKSKILNENTQTSC